MEALFIAPPLRLLFLPVACFAAPRLPSTYSLTSHPSSFQSHQLRRRCATSSTTARAGWFLGLGDKKAKTGLPDIVKAGDPVLHEPAREVDQNEIGSERIQKIIDDMVKVMRRAPGVGLAAPQIGIPLRVSHSCSADCWSCLLPPCVVNHFAAD